MTYEMHVALRLYGSILGLIWSLGLELNLCQPPDFHSRGAGFKPGGGLQDQNSRALGLVAGTEFSEDFCCQYLRSSEKIFGSSHRG